MKGVGKRGIKPFLLKKKDPQTENQPAATEAVGSIGVPDYGNDGGMAEEQKDTLHSGDLLKAAEQIDKLKLKRMKARNEIPEILINRWNFFKLNSEKLLDLGGNCWICDYSRCNSYTGRNDQMFYHFAEEHDLFTDGDFKDPSSDSTDMENL